MASSLYSVWLPSILVDVPTCSVDMVNEAVRDVVIDFCKRTKVLRVDADPFYTVIGDSSYTLTPPSDTQVIDVLTLKYNDSVMIQPQLREELDRRIPNWATREGTPATFLSTRPGDIVFDSIPQEVVIVRPYVAVKPSQTSQGVDEFIFEEFKKDIRHGVLAFLFSQPNKSYSNPALAAYHEQTFERRVSKAITKSQAGYNSKKQFNCRAYTF
jgi:Zn-finger nucleic acid-binding protein